VTPHLPLFTMVRLLAALFPLNAAPPDGDSDFPVRREVAQIARGALVRELMDVRATQRESGAVRMGADGERLRPAPGL